MTAGIRRINASNGCKSVAGAWVLKERLRLRSGPGLLARVTLCGRIETGKPGESGATARGGRLDTGPEQQTQTQLKIRAAALILVTAWVTLPKPTTNHSLGSLPITGNFYTASRTSGVSTVLMWLG